MMKLYGTTTSPYVRKVRIHAHHMGVPVQFVSTAGDAGQELLARVSPLWKVPVAEWDGWTILDSRVIVGQLWKRCREAAVASGLRPYGEVLGEIGEENLVTLVDGALDAAINRFVLMRDGTPEEGYVIKQRKRVHEVLRAVAGKLQGTTFTGESRLGTAEISLQCTLDWMDFRKQIDFSDIPALVAFRRAHADLPIMKQTYPFA